MAEATAGKSKPITVYASFFVYKFVIYELNQATKAFFRPDKDDVPSWLFLYGNQYLFYRKGGMSCAARITVCMGWSLLFALLSSS